ncbi:MAG: hypothetical protein QOG63_3166, partial [Thermoleophilaceae bacterium]|nr:hypothetical protein [Thermoleophilaceae bacterium]
YDPFVQVKDLDCWPSEPHWDQIVDGEKLRDRGVNLEWEANPLGHEPETLQWGEDFHHVVLGIPVAALPPICEELIADAGNPGFRAMIENSRTAMTQAFQVWLKRPSDRLGWPFRKNSVMTAYVEPMDTYSDMTHLLPAEAWPADERVAGIGYFCGVLPDHDGDTQERADARARANAIEYLEGDALGIWPDCEGENGGFHWGALVDPDGRRGPDRFDAQFWLANFQATERYVLTPPGNTKYRLAADESGYGNLALAGDWIKTGLDAGCVEAAVMGGMQASRAICGSPEVIVGEDQDWLSDQPASGGHGLPRYVDYGGLATAPSPVDCDDGKLYGFFLDADHARLADLCDRVFAQPSRGRVELFPLGSHVMLTFGTVAKIRPQREPWSRMGFARERQVALWVPVVAIDDSGERPVAASLAWFVPYMWVDNPLSLAGGREIYGFNKNWGEIAMPEDRDGRGLALQAYGGDFDGEREAGWNPLIEVTPRSGDPYGRGRRAWSGVDGLATAVQDVLRRRASEFVAHAGLELPDRVFTDIVRRGGPPQIYLKQFRSIARGDRASSLQITESGVTLKRITGRPLPAEFDVTLHHLDSHPVEAELGIRSQRTRLAFEVEMDFVLDEGTVLWQAPVR